MDSLPFEICGKFVEYASWKVFCALMFVNKKYHKICKDSILLPSFEKYIKICENGNECCEVLPNGVLHGVYENKISYAGPNYPRWDSPFIFEKIKTTYYFGRIHGKYRKKIRESANLRTTFYETNAYKTYTKWLYVNGHAYGTCIIHYAESPSEIKQLKLTYEEALKLPPAGNIMRCYIHKIK